MTCPFAQDDAVYVLGALSPVERLDFEKHLVGCEDCTRAVRELAGIPGLLSRVGPEVLSVPLPGDEPLPHSLLPGLALAARRSRRRRLLAAAGAAAAAAAAAAVVSPVVVSQLNAGDAGTSTGTTPVAEARPFPMDRKGEVPVHADLAMERVTWGTRLELTCTYDTQSVSFKLPRRVDYVIVVLTEDGHAERVGSWQSVDGMTMRLTAGTAVQRGQIKSVEVRTADGRVVLTRTA